MKFDPHDKKGKALIIDSNTRCTAECYSCVRQTRRNRGLTPSVGNHDMTIEELRKLMPHYNEYSFGGQMSDPIFNDNFLEMLQLLRDADHVEVVSVHTAATSKKLGLDWYKRAYEANPKAHWIFGIDGIDDSSEWHRVNQDSELLFNAMELGAKMDMRITWQYIVFSYNENDIDTAKQMADDMGVDLQIMLSGRFMKNDVFKPSKKEYHI